MTQPLNVLCPTYWYPSSPKDVRAIYVHDINRHLVRRGHRVCVVTPAAPGAEQREEFDGVEVRRFDFELPDDLTYGKVAQSKVSPLGKLKRLTTMAGYLRAQYSAALAAGREIGADVVHGHWAIPTGPAIVAAAERLGVPAVITMHGGDVYVNHAEGYDFPTRWYVKPVLRRTLRRADALTAISDDCRRHALNAGAFDERIRIIMNGADLRRFSPPAADGPRIGPDGSVTVFACRQLFPRKGIRFLIQAVAKIRPRHPGLKLVLAGDGFERPELERLAAELGVADATTFLGWVANEELPKYFRAAAVSVIPSLEEGFGIPAAEAMGCETPVIASDAGGLPEVVEHEATGLVVPKGDVDALAAALDRLLGDPELCRRMGRAGRERALRLFDWDIAAAALEDVYEHLVSGARDGR
jgi:glycosyltransferase involved in cell wall biosynthesis